MGNKKPIFGGPSSFEKKPFIPNRSCSGLALSTQKTLNFWFSGGKAEIEVLALFGQTEGEAEWGGKPFWRKKNPSF